MGKLVSLPTPKSDAVTEIQRIAREDDGHVYFTPHADERMIERDISRLQVTRTICNGHVADGPEWCTESEKGWKCRFRWISAGARINVVVKLIDRTDGQCDLVVTAWS